MKVVSEAGRLTNGGAMTGVRDRSIGAMLIDAGKLRPEDAEKVLRYAKEKGLRFGDAAAALRLVNPDDIQQALALQFDYPYLHPGEGSVSPEVVAAWAPFSAQVESFRALRSQLLLRWFSGEQGQKMIAVVSPGRGEGRSYTAANLAVVFSQMGEKTLLVDADLRNPRQHEIFGLANGKGLSSVLAERAGLDAVQRIPSLVDLSVLTSGPTPPNPLELLGRDVFHRFAEEVQEAYDVVILDTPASTFGSDFQLIASRAKGAIVVARKDYTRIEDCALAGESVVAAGAVVVGTVLNAR